MVGLSLWLGIFGGSWATTRWLSASIQSSIEQARQSLARIEEGTWRITLREIEGERFVVLSTGKRARWTVRGRPAVKLSKE